MIEHRCSRREAIEVLASLHQNGHFLTTGKIRNVNQNGLFLETTKVVPKNAFVEVLFHLSNEQTTVDYRLHAMVVHSSESGLGLYADGLAPKTQSALRALLSRFKVKQVSSAA